MSSDTTIIAAQFRLREWAAQIKECQERPAGMSVADWCACKGITRTNYYYHLRRVKEACMESVSNETSQQKIMPVEPILLHQEQNRCSCPGLDISIKGCSIHVTEGASMQLLAAVLEVVQGAE